MSAERLQKVLAGAGVASRRKAEELIVQGKVKVNGEVARLGSLASLEDDVIEVDGLPITRREAFEYYMLHKPRDVVTTVRDPQHRITVMHLLRGVKARVYPVGRLDEQSEGLLLLTNDGELAHRLTHPRYGVEKEYLVQLAEPASSDDLERMRKGIDSLGDHLRPKQVRQRGTEVSVILGEGKKREVRRMFEAVGHEVLRLRRLRFGPLQLGDLPAGRFRPLTNEEIERLRAATSG